MLRTSHLLAAALTLCLTGVSLAEDDFKPLFDGKSLAGWHGDTKLWTVKDGVIIGSTDGNPIKRNTFLATEKPYKNFVLRLKFKLRNHNSGVQFRSKSVADHGVRGYQADIADNQFMGILYDEGGSRGILHTVDADEVKKHIKPDDWNTYVITADGPHITQEINGFKTVDFTEKDEKGAKEGIIALQLHTGPEMQASFKDVEIKELP